MAGRDTGMPRNGKRKTSDKDGQQVQVKQQRPSGDYFASGLKNTLHGVIYQLKLLMMFLKRGLNQGFQFTLATEMDDAEKFDDLVFRYKMPSEGPSGEPSYGTIFLQAKHKQNDLQLIKASDLLNETDKDFSLQKYFKSYLKIRDRFGIDHLQALVICTNTNFHFEDQSTGTILKSDTRTLLVKECSGNDVHLELLDLSKYKLEKSPKFYKLVEVDKEVFHNASELNSLAKFLAESLFNEQKMDSHNALFKEYCQALFENKIIDRKADKFHKDFTSGSNNSDFRKAFEKFGWEIARKKYKIGKSEFWRKVEEVPLKFAKNFKTDQNGGASLPDDNIDDEDIREFLDTLIFAVDQPNEMELGKIMRDEIGETFGKISGDFVCSQFLEYVLDWMKDKKGTFLQLEVGEAFFQEAKCKIAFSILQSHTIKIPSEFSFEKLGTLHSLSTISDKIFVIITSCPDLTLAKVGQALQIRSIDAQVAKNLENPHLILNCRNVAKMQRDVILAAQYSQCHTLVIVAEETMKTVFEKAMVELFDMIYQKNILESKKVIMIFENSDQNFMVGLSANSTIMEQHLIKDELLLMDMDQKSQDSILSTKVMFQNQEITLEKLLLRSNFETVINGSILNEILNGTSMKIGKPLPEFTDSKYYLQRQLNYPCQIELGSLDKIIKASNKQQPFILCISGVSKNELSKFISDPECIGLPMESRSPEKRVILLQDSDKKRFNNFCKHYDSGRRIGTEVDIHWLHKDSNYLTWKGSTGCLHQIRQYMDVDNATGFSEHELCQSRAGGLLVIAGESGMGKSTLLLNVAHTLKNLHKSWWVITIRLIDFVDKLQSKKLDFQDSGQLLEFFYCSEKLVSNLERSLLRHRLFHGGEIAFLIDCFDEVMPDYKNAVFSLLDSLRATKAEQIWVATREYTQAMLEEQFSVIAYSLQPFTDINQYQYLEAFWTDDNISAAMISEFVTNLDSKIREFLPIPLLARMIVEVLQPRKESLTSPFVTDEINMLKLYQTFFEKKYEIFFQKMEANHKLPATKTEFKKTLQYDENLYGHLALKHLFPEHASTYEPYLLQHEIASQEVERYGIIKISKRKQYFIHQTFADYFAAMSIYKILQKDSKNMVQFLSQQLFHPRNDSLRTFLDQKLVEDVTILNAVFHDNADRVMDILSNNCEEITTKDKLGRNMLHFAAAYGQKKVYRFLFEQDESLLLAMDHFGCIPLGYGLLSKNRLSIIKFLNKKMKLKHCQNVRFPLKIALDRTSVVLFQEILDNLMAKQRQEAILKNEFEFIWEAFRNATFSNLEALLYEVDPATKKAIAQHVAYAEFINTAIERKDMNLAYILLKFATRERWQLIWWLCNYVQKFQNSLETGDIDVAKVMIDTAEDVRREELWQGSNYHEIFKVAIESHHWDVLKLLKYLSQDQINEIFRHVPYIDIFELAMATEDVGAFRLFKYASARQRRNMLKSSKGLKEIFQQQLHEENWKMARLVLPFAYDKQEVDEDLTTQLFQKYEQTHDSNLMKMIYKLQALDTENRGPIIQHIGKSNFFDLLMTTSSKDFQKESAKAILETAVKKNDANTIDWLFKHQLDRSVIKSWINVKILIRDIVHGTTGEFLNCLLDHLDDEQKQSLLQSVQFLDIAKEAIRSKNAIMLEFVLKCCTSEQKSKIFCVEDYQDIAQRCEPIFKTFLKYASDQECEVLFRNTNPIYILNALESGHQLRSDQWDVLLKNPKFMQALDAGLKIRREGFLKKLQKQCQDLLEKVDYCSLFKGIMDGTPVIRNVEALMNYASKEMQQEMLGTLDFGALQQLASIGDKDTIVKLLIASRYLDYGKQQEVLVALDYLKVYEEADVRMIRALKHGLSDMNWKEILAKIVFRNPFGNDGNALSIVEPVSCVKDNALDCLLMNSDCEQRTRILANRDIGYVVRCAIKEKDRSLLEAMLHYGKSEERQRAFDMSMCRRKYWVLDYLMKYFDERQRATMLKDHAKFFRICLDAENFKNTKSLLEFASLGQRQDMLDIAVEELKMGRGGSRGRIEHLVRILKEYDMVQEIVREMDVASMFTSCLNHNSSAILKILMLNSDDAERAELLEKLLAEFCGPKLPNHRIYEEYAKFHKRQKF